ncbi:MAG: hypothetical protein D6766_05770, partial [Verrucomicrobia bacterium]
IDAEADGERAAALKSLAILGRTREVGLLVDRISQAPDASRRDEYADTLLVLAGRVGRSAVSALLPLVKASDPARRIIGVHALATVGGDRAAQAVIGLLDDPATEVQDEVVRTLSTWPGNWPEDIQVGPVLQKLAREGGKPAHQVLGFRGYLQHLQVAPGLSDEERVERILHAMEQAGRPEERQAAISALGSIPSRKALEALLARTDQKELAGATWSALLNLAGAKVPGLSREERRQLLERIIRESGNEAIQSRARELLRRLR